VATLIGTLLGACGGFFGGKVGDLLEWLYNVFESIPNILLIFAFAAVVGRGVESVVLILALTGWTGMYRQVRAEFIKHAAASTCAPAEAIGASVSSRMFRHILPNVSHVILVRMSLLVVGFIKAEVILSYLGLGVRVDQVSWGTMLAEAQSELILGHWWQLATATLFMAVFVTAFSLMADALRDALDPKLRGAGMTTDMPDPRPLGALGFIEHMCRIAAWAHCSASRTCRSPSAWAWPGRGRGPGRQGRQLRRAREHHRGAGGRVGFGQERHRDVVLNLLPDNAERQRPHPLAGARPAAGQPAPSCRRCAARRSPASSRTR
jgi:ABC-type proline/glycine betaine transport system permease subunit